MSRFYIDYNNLCKCSLPLNKTLVFILILVALHFLIRQNYSTICVRLHTPLHLCLSLKGRGGGVWYKFSIMISSLWIYTACIVISFFNTGVIAAAHRMQGLIPPNDKATKIFFYAVMDSFSLLFHHSINFYYCKSAYL